MTEEDKSAKLQSRRQLFLLVLLLLVLLLVRLPKRFNVVLHALSGLEATAQNRAAFWAFSPPLSVGFELLQQLLQQQHEQQ